MNPLALANLLSLLIPLGMQVYTQIQQAHSGQLAPIEDVLAAADKNWDSVIANAQAELAKLNPPTQPPPPLAPA